MAYEFKKLSDVNVIETMNDSLNVLVENDGEIVKIAANEMMSAVEIPEGFSGSWNDLTDRPFSESVRKAVAFPEQSVAFTNSRAYLSGDFSKINYGHDAVHVVWDGVEYVCECAWFQEGYAFGNFSAYGGWGNGEPFNAMLGSNTGVTIESVDGTSPHTIEIFVYDEVTDPLDEKFIPATIARTANTATTWYVDSKISSLPEPFSGSWDDLTDKPFWELSNEMIPKEHHSIPYSEDYFCDAKVYQPIIAGEKYTLSWDTYVYEAICQENGTVSFDMPGFVNINGLVITSDDSTEKYKLEIIGTGTSYYLSATIGLTGPTPLQTIDEKFIPDTIARTKDIPEGFSGSWNDLTDKPFYSNASIVEGAVPVFGPLEMTESGESDIDFYASGYADVELVTVIGNNITPLTYSIEESDVIKHYLTNEYVQFMEIRTTAGTTAYKQLTVNNFTDPITVTVYYASDVSYDIKQIEEKCIPNTIPRLVTVNVDYDSAKGYEVASMTPLKIYEHYLAGDICQCTHAGYSGSIYSLVEISDAFATFSYQRLSEVDGEAKVYFNTITIDSDGKSTCRYKYL